MVKKVIGREKGLDVLLINQQIPQNTQVNITYLIGSWNSLNYLKCNIIKAILRLIIPRATHSPPPKKRLNRHFERITTS